MQTKPKSNSVLTHALTRDTDGQPVITFNVLGAGSVVLHYAQVHEANREYAAIHGLIQRCSDGAAKSRSADGKPASPMDKLAGIARIVEHLNSGSPDWRIRGEAKKTDADWLVDALAELRPDRGREALAEYVEKLSAKEIRALLASEKVRPIVERLRGQDTTGVDAEELLAGI